MSDSSYPHILDQVTVVRGRYFRGGAERIIEMDPSTGAHLNEWPVFSGQAIGALGSIENKFLVGRAADVHKLRIFDIEGRPLPSITIPQVPSLVGVDATADRVYCASGETDDVTMYDHAGNLIGTVLSGVNALAGLAADSDTNTIWIADTFGTVSQYDLDGNLLQSFPTQGGFYGIEFISSDDMCQPVGSNYCSALPNATGQLGKISGCGSTSVAEDYLVLEATQLPAFVFGFFLNSPAQGFVAHPGGSNGNLCLGGDIGRHSADIAHSGASGSLSLLLDLSALPRPFGTASVQPGDTWHFQAWHREGPSSNFTDGLTVTFD